MRLKKLSGTPSLATRVAPPELREKGVQAVSVSKICEGHVSRISQSLQNASSSKGGRPGLICGAKLLRKTGTCLPRDPAFTSNDFKRETGQEKDLPRAIHNTEPEQNWSFFLLAKNISM